MTLAVLIASILALAEPPPVRPIPYNCRADIRDGAGNVVGWVNLGLDEDRRPAHRDLHLRWEMLDATWDLDDGPASGPAAMRALTYTVELPRGTAFPVSVSVVGDGRRLWRGTVAQSTGEVMHNPGMASFPSIGFLWGRGREIANVYGIRRLEIMMRDGSGHAIPTARLPLPDWRWLGQRIAVARAQVERMPLTGGCGPSAVD
jgi:hypothetical protein